MCPGFIYPTDTQPEHRVTLLGSGDTAWMRPGSCSQIAHEETFWEVPGGPVIKGPSTVTSVARVQPWPGKFCRPQARLIIIIIIKETFRKEAATVWTR